MTLCPYLELTNKRAHPGLQMGLRIAGSAARPFYESPGEKQLSVRFAIIFHLAEALWSHITVSQIRLKRRFTRGSDLTRTIAEI